MKRQLTLIDSLTSLRFFAALGVFLHHLGILNNSENPLTKEMGRYFFNGYSGVTFFYILSGFIINYSFTRHRMSGKYDSKDFIVFRVSRLFPVHLLTLFIFIITFGVIIGPGGVGVNNLISNVFLVQSLIPLQDYYFAFNPVSWSISCELFFYFAFIYLVKLEAKYLTLILFFVVLVNIALIASPPSTISSHWIFYINPFFRISDFIIGMLFCRLFLVSDYEPNEKVCGVLEVLSIVSFLLTAYIATNYIKDMNVRYDLIFMPCMLFIVVAFSFNKGFISRFLSKKAFILLGEASFSFYMIHYIFVSKLNYMLLPSPNSTKELIYYISLAFSGALLSSIMIFKLIELPLNQFIRKSWLSFRYNKKCADK